MSDLKNVVIIGASIAGADLAHALEAKLPLTHRLILIDSNDFAFSPISALRAAVVPGWEKKCFRSLEGFFPQDSRHILLPKTRVVDLGKKSVEVDHELSSALGLGGGKTIQFEVCVLALGSTYSFPMRTLSSSLSEALKPFVAAQEDIKKAQTIVMVGGGPVSIEYAGEILSLYPTKSVTIVQSLDHLLPESASLKLAGKLQSELEEKGVKVVLGDRVNNEVANAGKGRVELKDGTFIDADLIVNASGVTPNTKIVASADAAALTEKGLITVDQSLKVVSTNSSSVLSDSYFAFGDCAFSPGGTTAMKAQFEAKGVAKNILAFVTSEAITPVAPPPAVLVVPIGPLGGSSVFPYIGVWGNWTTSFIKGKKLFTPEHAARYPNGEVV